MQGCIRFKNILQQRGGDFGVQHSSRLHHVLKAGFPFKHKQGTNPSPAQVHYGLYDLFNNDFGVFIGIPVGSLGDQPAASHALQRFAQFRLKQDHKNKCAVLQHGQQQPVQACQSEDIAQQYDQEQQEKAFQQGASPCMPGQQQQLINDHCHD